MKLFRSKTLPGEKKAKEISKLLQQAKTRSGLGKYEEAEHFYKQCLQLKRRSIAVERESGTGIQCCYDMMSINAEAADMWMRQHQFSKAEPFYIAAFEEAKQWLQESPNEFGIQLTYRKVLRETAFLYYLQGSVQKTKSGLQKEKWSKSEQLFRQVISVTESQVGRVTEELIDPLRNLASLYIKMGDFQKSELLFKRCIGIQISALGIDAPSLLATRQQLAIVQERKDRRKYYDAAVRIQNNWRISSARKNLTAKRKERLTQRERGNAVHAAAAPRGYFTPGAERFGDWDPEEEHVKKHPLIFNSYSATKTVSDIAANTLSVRSPFSPPALSLSRHIQPIVGSSPYTASIGSPLVPSHLVVPNQVIQHTADALKKDESNKTQQAVLTNEEIELLSCFPLLT